MNDAMLWEMEQAGHPVSHVRAKIEADRLARIAADNRRAYAALERRSYRRAA